MAAAWPALGVLSALSYPNDFAVALAAQASLRAAFAVDETLARPYNDLILATLSPAARAQLEAAMRPEEYEYQSEFARKHTAIGREQGREQGREEGRAEEAVRAVLAVFAARGMVVPHDVRERVEACSDLDLLAVWHTRAVKAESAEQIFDP